MMSPYVEALVRDGASVFLDNARVSVRALAVDDVVVPLVICEPGYANGDVCSPHTHYVLYTIEEFHKRHPLIPLWCVRVLASASAALFRGVAIDRVVYVNNWLFPTNPHQPFSSEQIEAVKRHLISRYPRHAIVFRTVNPRLHAEHSERLRACGFEMVKSRKIYLLDVDGPQFKERTNAKRDLRLLETSPYTVVGNERLRASDFPRLETLFRGLYLDKHSYLNPQFSRRFFEFMWRHDQLTYRALRKDGQIDGFVCFWVRGNLLTSAAMGYDVTTPRRLGLYRQVIALLIKEAQERKALLNMSAGAGRFKELRGAIPYAEYDAVYMRHLLPHRQIAWRLLQCQGHLW